MLRPDRLIGAAGRAVTDPRLVGMAQVLPRTAAVLRARADGTGPGMPTVPSSPALAAQIALDEMLISVMRDPRLFPRGGDYQAAAGEILEARRVWADRGWLVDPASYHSAPPPPDDATVTAERAVHLRYEHLTFTSGWEPSAGEPGRDRWLTQIPNRTAHAWVLRHEDGPRPWLVCLHGFGMGRPAIDLRAFRADALQRDLGLNLALVVLPMHGPRQIPGRSRGEGFMNINLVDSVHGLAQAAWDTRRVLAWIRATDPGAPIGLHGISLGGYVSALTASLDDGLSCVIAGVPATDLPDLYRRHSPSNVRRRAFSSGALGPEATAVHSVVSPLVLEPRVPVAGRFIYAGLGDRMATAGQARRLWEHWGRPRIEWYAGGHIGFYWAGAVQRLITEALTATVAA